MSRDFVGALLQLNAEKQVSREQLIGAVEDGIQSAYRRVAVMGCVVNGPGESKHADIGISLPGTFEEPVAPVFIDGRLDRTLRGEGLVQEFIDILEDYVARRFPAPV